MAEILGLLASATQLAQYTLKISAAISEIHGRVRGGPELRKHAAQIQQLLDTAIEIERNPQIHTPLVLRHLTSATDQAKAVLDLLEQLSADYTRGSLSRRYYKAARGGKSEKKIATSFRRLEQEKTSLIFCIGIGNSEQLYSIHTGVKKLAGDTISSELARTLSMPEKEAQNLGAISIKCPQGHLALISPKNQNDMCCPVCGVSKALETIPAQQWQGRVVITDQCDAQSNASSNFAASQTSYDNCNVIGADNNAKQQNGHLGNYVVGTYRYTQCTVTGNGAQFNGSASGEQAMAIASTFFSGSGGSVLNNKT